MEAIKKLFAIVILLAIITLNSNTSFSQCINLVPLAGPGRYEAQMPATQFFCVTTGTALCPPNTALGALTMPGMGINVISPNYELDILCDPTNSTNSDINISTTAATQNVGYRIGGNYVLWHNGLTSCIYVGVGAGNANTTPANCTFVGNNAGNSNATNDNTAMGYEALFKNIGGAGYGNQNVAMGNEALES